MLSFWCGVRRWAVNKHMSKHLVPWCKNQRKGKQGNKARERSDSVDAISRE